MTKPIVFITHCPVCGKPHQPSVIVADDPPDVILSRETCYSCWQWFRLEEFALVVQRGDAFSGKWSQPEFAGEVCHG